MKIKKILRLSAEDCGGRNRTRTCDPIDVNDVLYQLSHATICFSPLWLSLSDESYYSTAGPICQHLISFFSHLCFRPGRWPKAYACSSQSSSSPSSSAGVATGT